jgi:hypothetical protein
MLSSQRAASAAFQVRHLALCSSALNACSPTAETVFAEIGMETLIVGCGAVVPWPYSMNAVFTPV